VAERTILTYFQDRRELGKFRPESADACRYISLALKSLLQIRVISRFRSRVNENTARLRTFEEMPS
jgi:hypothetical protein